MFAAVFHAIFSLLVLCATAPARAEGGNGTDTLLLKNPGGSPDVQGTFLGENFLAFIAPSGFVALQYDPETNGDVTTTYGRFTSWQCINADSVPPSFQNMSVSRNVYDAVTYDTNGVVTSSGTFCNIYVVDVKTGRQWTTGTMLAGPGGAKTASGCPSVASVEDAFVQSEDAYINTQLINATIIGQPSAADLVCGRNTTTAPVPSVTNSTVPRHTPGLSMTSLPEVGTTIDGFPVAESKDGQFPPELAGLSTAVSAYNTTKTTASGENVTLEVQVQTLAVTNSQGYVMIGLTSINETPQSFYSVTSRGVSYQPLNTSSPSWQTLSSDIYINETVMVSRYDPTSRTQIGLDTIEENTPGGNKTSYVNMTRLTSFPAYGAVQPASAVAVSSGTSENGTTTYELSIRPSNLTIEPSPMMYFNLNLTSADRVVGAEIRNQTGAKGVIVQLVPSISGWPTAVIKTNKTLPRLLGPISGAYNIQGLFDLEGTGLRENGSYFVNIRTESSNGTARGPLVWDNDDQYGMESGTGGGSAGGKPGEGSSTDPSFVPSASGAAIKFNSRLVFVTSVLLALLT